MPRLLERAKRKLNVLTDEIRTLPLVVLMPHSRCNARCLMCDIWKANDKKLELSAEDLKPHLDSLRTWGTKRVVLSGGEALMHQNLWTLTELLEALDIKITLLSTGLTLAKHAQEVAAHIDEVTISLDGTQPIHDEIRNIPRAYEKLAEGVRTVKDLAPTLRMTGRSVLQRKNYRALPGIIDSAREIGLDQISFLPVDVSTEAFGRLPVWGQDRVSETALTRHEVSDLEAVVESTIVSHKSDFSSGFIAEDPTKIRRIVRYFAALTGDGDPPETFCNAPWVSTVIEADGTVRPCFFHMSLGNIRDASLKDILSSEQAKSFRRGLDVKTDPICKKCVCTLEIGSASEV